MTDILCNWLNNEVKLSVRVDPTNFSKEFSTGYLLGEVLQKYQLQNDFDQFSQARTADSKLNNFTRVEPVLHLLEVPFDTNVARDVMTERHGVATKLMYQLFIALSKKQKSNLTGVAMETMRPAAPVKLENVESLMYKERLKHMTPRQTDLNLEALVGQYHQKRVEMEKVAFKERFEEEEKYLRKVQEQRDILREQHRNARAKKTEMLAKIQAATMHIPKPPANKTVRTSTERREMRKQREAQIVREELDAFEDKLHRTLPPSTVGLETVEKMEIPDPLDLIKPSSNDEYINAIKRQLNEDHAAREEREKRRRKVLVDQLKAHEEQEEARREEMLVSRLMRQSQQERRIAVQLLQARHEKEIIQKNRQFREKQYEERRLKEFEEALNREAEMAKLANLEYTEQIKRDIELHNQIQADRAQERYTRHYEMCSHVLNDIVDLSVNVGDYRELTNKLLPPKLMRDWVTLFTEGQPLYEQVVQEVTEDAEPTPEQILEEERQKLLDETDFNEYRNMIGEWQPTEDCEISGPPANNPIVGHIVQRLFNIVHPPTPPPPAPKFPPFPIKACVLGKVFAGKTTACQKIAEAHNLKILDVEELVTEAIEAHKNNELLELDDVEEPEMADRTPTAEPEPTSAKAGSQKDTPLPSAQADVVGEGTPVTKPVLSAKHDKTQTTPNKLEEGMEKTDAEKPVPEEEDSLEPMATPRAELGMKAMKFLKKGKTVEDSLLVDIVVEAIRRLEEGTGWILDGFPATYAQAKLLEKALTGTDSVPDARSTPKDVKESKSKAKSNLAPDPRPQPPLPDPVSGLDVVILFELPDELSLKRSAGRTYTTQTDEQYHQEFNPPPEGAATGINNQEKIIPVEDPAHDMEQIQHRLTMFQDTWPKMEKWFSRIGNLQKVDADQEKETVCLELENILEQTIKKLEEPPPEESLTLTTEVKAEVTPEPVKPAVPEEKPVEPDVSRPASKKGSRTGSPKRTASQGGSADKKGKKSPRSSSKDGKEAKKSGKGSRGSSPKSPKRSGKKAKTPEPETEPQPEVPPGTPPPQPGSDLWEYVDEPLEEELAFILAPHWETVEQTYVDSSKSVFRSIRQEREKIIHYLYQIRQEYLLYLRRPDHKQEFVTQWQKDFNAVSDDLRDDEETRAELHERIDDLRERLWSICDDRKEKAEGEREGIMSDGWVDDRVGILTNHYVTLIQSEVDRFQDTIRLLKDYYKGMEGKIPDESQSDFIRLPLVELPVEDVAPPGEEMAEESKDDRPSSSLSVPETKPSSSKIRTPSGKKKLEEKLHEEAPVEDKKRIPLVPRRPISPDPGGKLKDKAKPKIGQVSEDGPPPPTDPDEKLIYDAFTAGVHALDKILAAEQAAREAEEEAERLRELEHEAEKLKAAADAKKKGGKGAKGGKKSRSPSPKKGGKGKETPTQPTPPPVHSEEKEEDKRKKLMKDRAKQEYFAAIQHEVTAAKTRMDLLRVISVKVITSLKVAADEAYKYMNDWLGARFLKEMESIDQMSEVMRFAVENGTKIHQELKIDQEDFLINQDIRVLRTPTPPPRPEPIEVVVSDKFTVDQIMAIYNQFQLTAPSGILSLKTFQEIMSDMTSLSHGEEQMPEAWLNLSSEKLEAVAVYLSADGEYIDWHGCLLQLAQPWPVPTQSDLLTTLDTFKQMDQASTGCITREQYQMVELWFGRQSKPPTPADPVQALPYDRLAALKDAFFELFADHSSEPSELNYVNMLLYFSVATDPGEGFLRALSVAAGTHMPRLKDKKIVMRKPSRPASQASMAFSEVEVPVVNESEDNQTDDIPESAYDARVPLEALHKVLHHGQCTSGDSHRFSISIDPNDEFSRERLAGIYQELGSENLEPLEYIKLVEHPVLQDMFSSCNTYRALDLKAVLSNPLADSVDAQSVRATD